MNEEAINEINTTDENCSGSCATCGSTSCSEKQAPTPRYARCIVALASGKGGTGKSVMACLLAGELRQLGCTVGILDADLACPAIPMLMGSEALADSDESHVFPVTAANGVRYISMGNIYDKPESPLLWYGKDQAGGAQYFYTDVQWEDPDVLIVDMPSGFGDIPLQLYTVIPFDAAVLVGTPDPVCDRMLKKTRALLQMVYVPVMGVIENRVPDAQTAAEHAEAVGARLLAAFPEDEPLARAAAAGALYGRSAAGLRPLAGALKEIAQRSGALNEAASAAATDVGQRTAEPAQ